jgi:modulator of drug activity B
MKTRIFFAMLITVLTFGTITAQTKSADKQKTVLLLNAHLTYPGLSEGKLNKAFYDKAKEFFLSQNFKVLETKIEAGYNVERSGKTHASRHHRVANTCELRKYALDIQKVCR